MFRLIWNSWWRNKERFLLLIIGALIVSIGLSYLVGITQASNATVVDELQKRWNSSYDIVVRPPDSRSVTEDLNLLEPNYLSGLDGGISLDQYKQILEIPAIDIAAPIAMMGYIRNSTEMGHVDYNEPGIYRVKIKTTNNTGANQIENEGVFYFTSGWKGIKEPNADEYGVGYFDGKIENSINILIAGIDPVAEASLVGIDEAMVEGANSRFLSKEDRVETFDLDTQIPVIISNQEFTDGTETTTIEKLDISFADDPSAAMEEVKENGGETYLDKQPGTEIDAFTYTTKDTHEKTLEEISEGRLGTNWSWMSFKPSSVNYREVTSPFAERWPFAYEVEPYFVPEDSLLAVDHAYRPVSMFGENSSSWPRLRFDFKGIYDPSELNISKDPLTELPMETYFPSTAKQVLDKSENPVNPPKDMKPLNNPYGFLTKPPLMLTTLDAAAEVLGEKPISAIRLKVKGVEALTEESEQILQTVANEIEKKTGLITDITLGSSPQPALTHIPGVNDQEGIGWVEQPWIKIGSSMSIFSESKIGMTGVIVSVIAVAVVYVFSINIIMMYARKKEFALLLSVGWRPNQLTKLLFIEAALIGLFVSMISWLILGLIYVSHDIQTSGLRLVLIGVFGITIYLLGAFIPGLLVRNISPYETMKTGEVSTRKKRLFKTTSIFRMSLQNLVAKWKRSSLSVIAIALPTGLLIFFLFVTFQLRGTMFTTWLGEYVALEVGSMHYIAMGVAIAIAILTTAEIIWQNVAERQPELAVLKAVGWHNKIIQTLVLLEGGLSGLIAGVFGLLIAIGAIWGVYGQFPLGQLPFFLVAILIPVITGIIGALLPAHRAGKIQPYQGLMGSFVNTRKTERSFKYAFGVLSIFLVIGIITLLSKAIPDVQEADIETTAETVNVTGTSGSHQEGFSNNKKENPEDAADQESEQKSESSFIDQKINDAYLQLQLDEPSESADRFYKFTLADTPEDIQLERKDSELITVLAERKNEDTASIQYQPHLGYQLFDEKGNEYDLFDYKILDKKNWDKIFLKPEGEVKILLTYEVPIDTKRLILYGYEWLPKSGYLSVEIR